MEDWKISQLSQTRDMVRAFLSGEKKSSKEDPDARTLRLKLFDFLIDHKMQHLKAEPTSARLTRYQVIEFMEGFKRAEYLKKTANERKKIDARLRARKASLSDSLERFDAVGNHKKLPFSLYLEHDSWDLNHREHDCAMKRFWEPYLACTRVNIVYGENVFFRTGHDKRIFIRHLDCNDKDKTGEKDIQEKSGLPAQWWWQGGTQFTSSGDCAAVVRLVQQFERNGLLTRVIRAAELTKGWEPGENEALIVLGNGRVIPWIPKLLKAGAFDWQIEAKGIKNRKHRENPEDDFSKTFISGIVARTCRDGRWVTIIAANHGRFCEASVRCFSSERDLARVFEANGWQSLPERFEFKATVDLTELEDVDRESLSPIPYTVTD